MELTSPAFTNGNPIPDTFTCKGNSTSPPLNISGVPDDAQSLVLLVHDPDAPHGDFIHWTVWNIPPDTTTIPEGNTPPDAVEGLGDFGKTGYGAPCPPGGTHRYLFELYALSSELPLESGASTTDLTAALEQYTLAKAALMGIVSASTQL